MCSVSSERSGTEVVFQIGFVSILSEDVSLGGCEPNGGSMVKPSWASGHR